MNILFFNLYYSIFPLNNHYYNMALFGILATAATGVIGGVVTVGATVGGFMVGGPVGATAAAVAGANATAAAMIHVAVITLPV